MEQLKHFIDRKEASQFSVRNLYIQFLKGATEFWNDRDINIEIAFFVGVFPYIL